MSRSVKNSTKQIAFSLIAAIGLVTTVSGGDQSAQPQKPQPLSLLNQPLGEIQADVMAKAADTFGSEPQCLTQRTGVGMTRRAYFLETCTLSNQRDIPLFESIPQTITYHFLETVLVQVIFEFDQIRDESLFRQSALAQGALLEDQSRSAHGIDVDDDFRTSVSDRDTVSKIHLLR